MSTVVSQHLNQDPIDYTVPTSPLESNSFPNFQMVSIPVTEVVGTEDQSSVPISALSICDKSPQLFVELSRISPSLNSEGARLVTFPPGSVKYTEVQRCLEGLQDVVIIPLTRGLMILDSCGAMVDFCTQYSVLGLGKNDVRRDSIVFESPEGGIQLLVMNRSTFESLLLQDWRFADFLAARIPDAFPLPRMPDSNRESIRKSRDLNVHTLVTKNAIRLTSRGDGVLEILNPNAIAVEECVFRESSHRQISTLEQAWQIIRSIEPVLNYISEPELVNAAQQSRRIAEELGGTEHAITARSLALFQIELRELERELLQVVLPTIASLLLASKLEGAQRAVVTERLLKIYCFERILGVIPEYSDREIPSTWDSCLESEVKGILSQANPYDGLLHWLDEYHETLSELIPSSSYPDLEKLMIRKLPYKFITGENPGIELPRDHRLYCALEDLDSEIERGAVSAIDGHSYALMRFSEEVLDAGARGETEWVFYEGHDHERAIEWARRKFGVHEMDSRLGVPVNDQPLIGVYGAFNKSVLHFRNGRSVVVVSYTGEGRQLSNAAAALWYKDKNDERLSLDRIHLVKDRVSLRDRLQSDLASIVEKHEAETKGTTIFDQTIEDPSSMKTLLVIAQHPEALAQVFRDDICLSAVPSETLGTLHLGYGKGPDGTLFRILVPSVGSKALYHDTAGVVVDIFARGEIVKNPIKHIIKSATAGGYRDTASMEVNQMSGHPGLPPVEPGAFIAPFGEIVSGSRRTPMKTLLEESRYTKDEGVSAVRGIVERLYNEAGVHSTWAHGCVPAPAFETFSMVDQMVREGISSVDVESDPCNSAARENGCTFTPIYYMSDDPRDARKNPKHALAWGGPLAETPTGLQGLYRTIRGLIELALALDQFEKERKE